jgi:tRNA (guanine10-N2)-methyltransferase
MKSHPLNLQTAFELEPKDWGVRRSSARLRKLPILNINYRHGSKLSTFPPFVLPERQYSKHEPYIPPTKPYELSLLAADLVVLARYLLKPDGRLVFFLPTVNEQYEEVDIQSLLCDGMVLVANSLQDFGSWGRRVRPFPPFFQDSTDMQCAARDYSEDNTRVLPSSVF